MLLSLLLLLDWCVVWILEGRWLLWWLLRCRCPLLRCTRTVSVVVVVVVERQWYNVSVAVVSVSVVYECYDYSLHSQQRMSHPYSQHAHAAVVVDDVYSYSRTDPTLLLLLLLLLLLSHDELVVALVVAVPPCGSVEWTVAAATTICGVDGSRSPR